MKKRKRSDGRSTAATSKRLVHIEITQDAATSLWDVVRERAVNDMGAKHGGGESASGLRTLREALMYIFAHESIAPEKSFAEQLALFPY